MSSRDRRSKTKGRPVKRKSCSRCNKTDSVTQVLEPASCRHRICYACLSSVCAKALKGTTSAKCWVCSQEISLDHVERVLSRADFVMYTTQLGETATNSDCVSCAGRKDKRELRVAPCGHYYCQSCVHRMCRLALGDRALVPLRCCKKELPDDYVHEALATPTDYAKYQTILKEKDWMASDLESDVEYAATVRAVGAKQCPGCGIGVQRDFGCVHMACPNGHQFCYTCLRVWGSCQCPLIPDAELQQILGE